MIIIPIVLFLCLTSSVFADSELLYYIDFSSPLHVVGQSVTTGPSSIAPAAMPESIKFGNQFVQSSVGDLSDQPALFVPGPANSSSYSQMLLRPESFKAYPYYRLDFQLYLSNLQTGGFTVLFDTPSSNSMTFGSDSRICQSGHCGNYPQNKSFWVTVMLDIPHSRWQLFIDGKYVFTNDLRPWVQMEYFRTLRFNLRDDPCVPSIPVAAIDNISLYGSDSDDFITPQISELIIFGPTEVKDDSTVPYNAAVYYDDHTNDEDIYRYVTWSVSDSNIASITANGSLTTYLQKWPSPYPRQLTIYADYEFFDISIRGSINVTITCDANQRDFVCRNLASAALNKQKAIELLSHAAEDETRALKLMDRDLQSIMLVNDRIWLGIKHDLIFDIFDDYKLRCNLRKDLETTCAIKEKFLALPSQAGHNSRVK